MSPEELDRSILKELTIRYAYPLMTMKRAFDESIELCHKMIASADDVDYWQSRLDRLVEKRDEFLASS